ncbi:MAG: VanW family protein [Flammeovirgaceae bacterium]
MKKLLKRILSPKIRIQLRLLFISLKDRVKSLQTPFVQVTPERIEAGEQLPKLFCITQPIRSTTYAVNKVHNIELALTAINNLIIYPGELFSFWRLVGEPSEAYGFKVGRSIIGETLSANVGGGLCQLSGMLYYLAIQAGINIVERHTHSYDLYNAESRYTPLGSDATVAYGYKDLRFFNNVNIPFCFRFELSPHKITAWLCASQALSTGRIDFEVEENEKGKFVRSYRLTAEGKREFIAEMVYKHYDSSKESL